MSERTVPLHAADVGMPFWNVSIIKDNPLQVKKIAYWDKDSNQAHSLPCEFLSCRVFFLINVGKLENGSQGKQKLICMHNPLGVS